MTRAFPLLLLTLLLALAGCEPAPEQVRIGSNRWLGYGPVTFQPSELAKLVGILYAASCLSKLVKNGKAVEFFYPLSESRRASLWQRMRTMPNPALWVPLLFVLFVGLQPDMGTAAVIFAIPALMTACGGARITKAKVPILLAVALVVLYISIAPYRLNRIVSYYDPWSYEKTLGYQTVQSLIAIGSSGFLGQGIGNGVSKFSYLPEAHTDFAFAIFAQEWGVFGSLFMVGLFAALLIFGIFTATRAADAYGLFLSMGITMYIGLQGFVNLAMVCGTLPVVGVPLPFVSYGGTSLIVNMSAAALLLNVARQNLRDSRKAPPAAEREKLPSIKEETRSRFPLH